MLRVIEGLANDIFGIEADSAFDEEDQARVLDAFEARNDKKPIRKLLLCFTETAQQSQRAFDNRFANWTVLRNVEAVALVGPRQWHDKFTMMAAAIRAEGRIFEPSEREEAIEWLRTVR